MCKHYVCALTGDLFTGLIGRAFCVCVCTLYLCVCVCVCVYIISVESSAYNTCKQVTGQSFDRRPVYGCCIFDWRPVYGCCRQGSPNCILFVTKSLLCQSYNCRNDMSGQEIWCQSEKRRRYCDSKEEEDKWTSLHYPAPSWCSKLDCLYST